MPSPLPSITPSPSPSPQSLRGVAKMILDETIGSFINSNSNSNTTNMPRRLRHSFELVNYNNYEIQKIMMVLFGCIIMSAIIFAVLYIMIHKAKKMNVDVRTAKAKQSPFIVPSINTNLPQYMSLDSAERGQNIHIDCTGPYRRLTPTKTNDGFKYRDTNITITVH